MKHGDARPWPLRALWRLLVMVLVMVLVSGCATGQHGRMQCVPYARQQAGIRLKGDAADWWQAADGRYIRSAVPAKGSVLVFQRTARLPAGHVAVVAQVLDPGMIVVAPANWVPGRITHDDTVQDVSAGHDWSLVRVWWQPAGQMGLAAYPTYGFIWPITP